MGETERESRACIVHRPRGPEPFLLLAQTKQCHRDRAWLFSEEYPLIPGLILGTHQIYPVCFVGRNEHQIAGITFPSHLRSVLRSDLNESRLFQADDLLIQ